MRNKIELVSMRTLQALRLKRFCNGEEYVSFNYTPSVAALPNDFVSIPDDSWRSAKDEEIRGAIRRYIDQIRCEGERVDVDVSDGGIVVIDLLVNGEMRSIWFNAWTSSTVALVTDNKM